MARAEHSFSGPAALPAPHHLLSWALSPVSPLHCSLGGRGMAGFAGLGSFRFPFLYFPVSNLSQPRCFCSSNSRAESR